MRAEDRLAMGAEMWIGIMPGWILKNARWEKSVNVLVVMDVPLAHLLPHEMQINVPLRSE